MPKRLINRAKYRVTFYEYVGNDGPVPGEKVKSILYECWANIEEVWAKDLELAKANGTLNDVTVKIRDPKATFQPTNKHYISINSPLYKDKHFNVKNVAPDLRNRREIRIVAEVIT